MQCAEYTPSFTIPLEAVMATARDRAPDAHQDAPLPKLVDIQSVSGSLGVSMRQIRRWVAEGMIPFVRVGHLIRFDPEELKDWIDARRSGSVEQR
jgi:excisionase family DNA binding protein